MSVVLYEVRDRIAYMTMNRPEKRNAINSEMLRELFRVFREVKRDPDVWVAIITGAGQAFSAGHDLADFEEAPLEETADDLYVYISEIWKPIIAAINGFCLAQGAGIALLTDIRIASERAQFIWPQVKRGLGSISGPSILADRIPIGIALEHLLTGQPFGAQEAHHWGLVNHVVSHEEVMHAAEQMARRILENAPLAVRAMKEMCIRNQGLPLRQRVATSMLALDSVNKSRDAVEGRKAFLEKRLPVWRAE